MYEKKLSDLTSLRQMAIEQGSIKFEVPTKPMNINGHPFPTNMVDSGGKKNALHTKLLISHSMKESGTVDPKVQASTDQVKGKDDRMKLKAPRSLRRKSHGLI